MVSLLRDLLMKRNFKKRKCTRYSIESIHLLPYDAVLTHLPSEISFCTLQRATVSSDSAHNIGSGYNLLVFDYNM